MNNLVRCRVCLKYIPEGAAKCTECGSFQDWRRYLGISSTTLALLVALISVLSIAMPTFIDIFSRDRAELTGIVGYTSWESLHSPDGMSSDVISLVLVLSNSGNRDAIIASVWWKLPSESTTDWKQARFFSDLDIVERLIVHAKSSRALMVYIDEKCYEELWVAVDYYGAGESIETAYLPSYFLPPASLVEPTWLSPPFLFPFPQSFESYDTSDITPRDLDSLDPGHQDTMDYK